MAVKNIEMYFHQASLLKAETPIISEPKTISALS
jgi:hypothetical protein